MAADQDDVQRLTEALEQYVKAQKNFTGGFNNGIHIDAGGVALGISIALVAVLATICFMQNGTITRMNTDLIEMERKLDRNEDYVNSIYRTLNAKPKGS